MIGQFNEMTPEEREALISEFLTEGVGYLQILNEKLVEAENAAKQGTAMSDNDLHEMFRVAHNIKGMASFVGLDGTTKLTHEMETVLQKIRNKDIGLTVAVIEVLFEAFDALETEFAKLKDTGTEDPNVDKIVEKIRNVLGSDKADAKPARTAPQPAVIFDAQTEEKVNLKYLSKFIDDSEQNIDSLNEILLSIESGKASPKILNELFRIVHTLKGSAGLISAKRIAKVAHKMENILSHVRDTKTLPEPDTISILFAGVDIIRDMISFYKSNSAAECDVEPICGLLDEAYSRLQPGLAAVETTPAQENNVFDETLDFKTLPQNIAAKCQAALTGGLEVFRIIGILKEYVVMKDVKTILAMERLGGVGDITAYSPHVDKLKKLDKAEVQLTFILISVLSERDIRGALNISGLEITSIERMDKSSVSKAAAPAKTQAKVQDPLAATPARADAQPEEKPKDGDDKTHHRISGIELSTIRIDSKKLDNLMNLSGELVIVKARFAQMVHVVNRELGAQREISQAINDAKSSKELLAKEFKTRGFKQDAAKTQNGRLEEMMEDMDAALDAISAKAAKNNLSGMLHSLDEIANALGKISGEIQGGVMQARMVPIEGVFTRFKRVVRDIAKMLDKDVELVIEGEETELDKKIVDSLGDPLTHMIRNAVDHGIEDLETRKRLGKPAKGTVLLKASHQGNNIWIEIKDDGRGLDPERLAQVAQQKGIVTAAQVGKMSVKDKLNLIFLPGFSTAEKVTGVSGRGVGMDVVKEMISSVSGTVDIETSVGKGTSFVLKIPLTLAIIKALLVHIAGEIYAFPLDLVVEIVKVSASDVHSVDGSETIKLREHALSIIRLQDIIGIGGTPQNDAALSRKIVVVTDGFKKIGIVVDTLIGEEEIVIKSLPEQFAKVKGISGASILGDGAIALILDPMTVINWSKTA